MFTLIRIWGFYRAIRRNLDKDDKQEYYNIQDLDSNEYVAIHIIEFEGMLNLIFSLHILFV